MIRKKENGIEWLEFELLQEIPSLKHAVFLRHGGVSPGEFGSLNAGGSTGDSLEFVQENRNRMMNFFPEGDLISCYQVHGTNLQEVGERKISEEGTDGLITRNRKKALMIKHADCQSALFYDPVEKILANVHAGWRGNVQNIYAKTLDALKSMGSNPSNLLVCISPSLGPNRSEFIHYKTEFPSEFLEFQWKETYFNLWEVSRMQLKELGILPSHMEFAEICTHENEKDYFSYRRDKITGRHASIAMLC